MFASPSSVPCARATLVGPPLWALLLGVAAAASACGSEEQVGAPHASTAAAPLEPPYDHVVLVTLDTLRADHLSSYGYARDTAPFLARLAAEGVLFESALASVSHTAPSHATMLTGLPPRLHGVRRNGNKLAQDMLTLPDLLRARGFASAAFLGAQFLSGIAQDFEHVSRGARPTSELVDQAIAWARERGDQPYFLWLHLYDPHQWKRPKLPAWARASVVASGADATGSFLEHLARLHGVPELAPGGPLEVPWSGADAGGQTHTVLAREQALEAIDDYDGLIRFADAEVERLHAALAERAPARKGLWIVTSDHGEGLGSHGYEGHGGRIYNEQLRVALVFHATDGSLRPRRVTELAGHVDLLPTLAELFGLAWRAPHAEFLGRSLVPLLSGADGLPARLFFAEQRRAEDAEAGDAGEMVAIQDSRHKLIRYPDGREELFALGEDPLELRDASASGARRAELSAALDERLRFFSGLGQGELEAPAPEFLEELQELGYAR